MSLDIGKLRHTVTREDGVIIAQCPACAEKGNDLHGKNHLIVYSNGGYGCVVHPGGAQGDSASKEHLRRIFQLAGDCGRAGGPKTNAKARGPVYGCVLAKGTTAGARRVERRW
jgi:hypothetical protein